MNKYILFNFFKKSFSKKMYFYVILFYYRAAYINNTEYDLMVNPNVSAVCYYMGLFC